VPAAIDPAAEGRCWREMVEKAWAASDRKNGKGFYGLSGEGPRRNCGPALRRDANQETRSPTRSTWQGASRTGWPGDGRRWRRAPLLRRGACSTDVREGRRRARSWDSALRRFSGGTLSYIDMMGIKRFRRAVPAPGEKIRRAAPFAAVQAAARTWRRRARVFYGRFAPGKEGGVMKSMTPFVLAFVAALFCDGGRRHRLAQGLCCDYRRTRSRRCRPADRSAPRSGQAPGVHRREKRE